MREPRLLDEKNMKEIEELLANENALVNWKDGVLEDYWYTKEFLLAKEREEMKKQEIRQCIVLSAIFSILILILILVKIIQY